MAGAAVDVAAPAKANGAGAGCCAAKGPGYATPREAMEKGPREGLLYVTCVYNGTYALVFATYSMNPSQRVIPAYLAKTQDEGGARSL
jgi:hypothetical protein